MDFPFTYRFKFGGRLVEIEDCIAVIESDFFDAADWVPHQIKVDGVELAAEDHDRVIEYLMTDEYLKRINRAWEQRQVEDALEGV